jgi:hypothetical protein
MGFPDEQGIEIEKRSWQFMSMLRVKERHNFQNQAERLLHHRYFASGFPDHPETSWTQKKYRVISAKGELGRHTI